MSETVSRHEELPVSIETEVLVCGGGPAGLGAKVLIVEQGGCLGGVATAGMMSHWGGRSSSAFLPVISRRTLEKSQNGMGYGADQEPNINAIQTEVQKIVLEEMAMELGVSLLYYTLVCDAVVEDGRMVGVIIQNKTGRSVIKAKCFVDATGDGDVAASAGVPYYKGRESDGKMQPCTLMFHLGGVDYDRGIFPGSFEATRSVPAGEIQALGREHLPFPAGHVLLCRSYIPGTVTVNMTNSIEADGTKAEDLTEATLACRGQIEAIIAFLQKYAPGYEHCWLQSSAERIGVRETRHFEGEETLVPENILQAAYREDWCVRHAFFNFDVHNLTGPSLDPTGIQKKWAQPDTYTIPYGCIVPKKIDGLLLSGRNISGTHLAHSNFRIMSVCIALGEAAGVAAALSVQTGVRVRDLAPVDIQRSLENLAEGM